MTLIEKLENAPEGSRELDAEIALSRRFPDYKYPAPVLNRRPSSHEEAYTRLTHDGFGGGDLPPHYTTSLDAARALSDWLLLYASDIGADGLAMVKLGLPDHGEVTGIHSRLEIAWCIAALKAREADDD